MEYIWGCLILQKKGLSSGTGQAKVIRSLITINFFSTYFKRSMQALCQCRQSPFQHFSAIFEDGNTAFLTANDYTSRNRAWTLASVAVNLLQLICLLIVFLKKENHMLGS